MRTAKGLISATAFAAALTLIAAADSAAVAGAPVAGTKTDVSVRFSWKMKGEYGPLYVALDKGYFAAEGLNVQLKEGAGLPPVFASLLKGDDQISWMPAIYAMQAISKGMPIKIISLYNVAAPIVLVSWPDKPIRTPKDMEGKRIATAAGDTGAHFMPVLCRKNNVDCSKIQLVNIALGAQVQAFVGRLVDGVALYRTNDLPILKADSPHPFVEMDETKFGLVLPGGSLVASDDVIAKQPDMLKKFVRAANKGMEDAGKDPLGAARIMLKYWKTSLPPEIIASQIKATVDATSRIEGKPLGLMDEASLRVAVDGLKEVHLIDEVKPLNEYYTNNIVLGAAPTN